MLLTILAAASVTIPIATLTLYVAPFVSLGTELVAKVKAPAWFKVGVTAALAAAATFVTMAINNNSDLILKWETLGRVGMAFAMAEGAYLLLKLTPLSKITIDPIAAKFPGGVGPEVKSA